MTWELIWMLVILKIPVIYLCAVVVWAIRAKPVPLEPALRAVEVEPDLGPRGRLRPVRPSRGGPHGAPRREARRQVAQARAAAR